MPVFLFIVEGHESKGPQIGLLPGIPQSLLADPEIGNLKQGSNLLLALPDGTVMQTKLAHYYITVPDEMGLDPSSLPIVPVLPPNVSAEMAPLGTKVYATGAQDTAISLVQDDANR